MRCEVLRPFTGPNSVELKIGEIVDTTSWLWTQQLIEQRYLRPVVETGAMVPPQRERPVRRVSA